MSAFLGKPLAFLVSLCLTVTAAAAIVDFTTPDSGSGGSTMSSPDPPKTTGFDSPVTPVVGPRPLLVVLLQFSDLPADVPASFIQTQVHGPRPSLNDYYLETSYGMFSFSDLGNFAWVTAWDDPATPGDESTRSFWSNYSDPVWGGGSFHSWGLISLDKAGYDFAPLDINNDGTINLGSEVAYFLVDSQWSGARGGATRGQPPITLDGKAVTGANAGISEDSPWITLFAHELGHQTLGLPDYYGITPQNIGVFSLMGFSGTGGWAGPIGPQQLDPYSKLKLGWLTPTVVTSDGFYDIPNSEMNPVTYILHEPARGTDEYFLVENKWRGTSYDNSEALIPPLTPPMPPAHEGVGIPDEGLLVWHVDETRAWDGMTTGGYSKVALERRGGGDDTAAWNGDDPGYYDLNDRSAPVNSNWNGGAFSKTGIWCVSPAGETMRAWLDVPGPGILICSGPLSASAVPGAAATITVPLRNTGEVPDTFAISVTAPPDVSATLPSPVTIAPGASTSVDVQLTPIRACTTAPGPRTVTIIASSMTDPAVSSSTTATLNVLSFSEPSATLPVSMAAVDPGMTATYNVDITNGGNDLDTFSLAFAGLDFGTAYRADPTAIPTSWVSFSPTDPSAPACGMTSSVLTIAVPPDWAGMEDARYDFTVTVSGSITSDTDTVSGQLIVHATPESMMFYVRVEIVNLIADVLALPPADVRDGLYSKANSTLNKFDQAVDRYLMGDDPPASNLFGTCQNKLNAFLHLLDAQRGKALTVSQADDLAAKAQQIIDDIEAILAEI